MLRWMIFLFGVVYLADTFVNAQEVPMVNDEPRITKTLDREMFDFVSKTLGGGKMAAHMKCTLKTSTSRKLRKFSDGEKWIETLEVDFNSNGFDSGNKMNFKIPENANYGVRQVANQWSGFGEDIKIDMGDYYGHWIRFTHDGQGRLVQLMLGNNLKTAPCQVR